MIALLSAVLGFFSSAMPDFLRMLRDRADRQHEITLLKLQMEYGAQQQAQEIALTQTLAANALQRTELQESTAQEQVLNTRLREGLTGVAWVDALAGTVRPVITYGFFLLYFLVKCAQFSVLQSPPLPWAQALTLPQALVALWGEEDIAIFSAILAFWFGQRTLLRRK